MTIDQGGSRPTGCGACERLALAEPAPSERVVTHGGWSVAHSFNANLEGWCVVLPQRHVEALDELTADELAALGPLLAGLTAALRSVVGCEKTYVLLLAESEGFHHVHFHVVPRGADLAPEHRGVRVFSLLNNPELEIVPRARRDELALALRAHLVGAGVCASP